MPTVLEIQNALRLLAIVANGKELWIEGDLVSIDGVHVGRTQEAAELLSQQAYDDLQP